MTTKLEELTPGLRVRGVVGNETVTVLQTQELDCNTVTLVYRTESGQLGERLLYREDETELATATQGRSWPMSGDPALFRLVSEAKRISLASLFDPFLATETSDIDPLPHQIEAVYQEMLPRQPLRFLLADDPGAGKTVMTGLLIKELQVRGDLARCLVVAPGNLAEQWQDELWEKFGLDFEIFTREMAETSRSGNPFAEKPCLIARLDQLARDPSLIAKAEQCDWDLIVVDEAHKMSARYNGDKLHTTKRYQLGERLRDLTRHFLLLTATPHNGKEADFHLFLALLDPDRFAGRFRPGTHPRDISDLMRRMIKEDLLRFDGRRLFPERVAQTAKYSLSPAETHLYEEVTAYVREGMHQADRLHAKGEKTRGTAVGFALTILQRRLASSPRAICRSLERRHARLLRRYQESQSPPRPPASHPTPGHLPHSPAKNSRRNENGGKNTRGPNEPDSNLAGLAGLETLDADEMGELAAFDFGSRTEEEAEILQEEVMARMSGAETAAELQTEIAELARLMSLAQAVTQSNKDRKWDELAKLLQDTPEMHDADGRPHKLLIFTEHRDTLEYLVEQLRNLLGRHEAVAAIHGKVRRAQRREIQERFTQDKDLVILVATDAAGEGVNLQRAHLVINYDLPWNPNRIEQRFGRVHRIGQTEICHLWNLVAENTREGEVFTRLFTKIEEQRKALGGQVFDVLGAAFSERSLRDLLVEAVRYGEDPLRRTHFEEIVDTTLGETTRALIQDQALTHDIMNTDSIGIIRHEMERAAARRLQPHFVRRFFIEAFRLRGGRIVERETGRYEITRVPTALRDLPRNTSPPLPCYERIVFERHLRRVPNKPAAELLCPGHPLLDAVLHDILTRHDGVLKEGSILVDPTDPGTSPRLLVSLIHTIERPAAQTANHSSPQTSTNPRPPHTPRPVSTRFTHMEINQAGHIRDAGHSPFLDYAPPTPTDQKTMPRILTDLTPTPPTGNTPASGPGPGAGPGNGPNGEAGPVNAAWIQHGIEKIAVAHTARHAAKQHFTETKTRITADVTRIRTAVEKRLRAEITHWDAQANQLQQKEHENKREREDGNAPNTPQPGRGAATRARHRADELEQRLQHRLAALDRETALSSRPPQVVSAALIIPAGLLATHQGETSLPFAVDTRRVERLAVTAVLSTEKALGRTPEEMPPNHKGYDIESTTPDNTLLFLEVKGRVAAADTFTVTANEIATGRNLGDRFILALVEVATDNTTRLRYLPNPFTDIPKRGFAEIASQFSWKKFWKKAQTPT